jgi:hypothetical protein
MRCILIHLEYSLGRLGARTLFNPVQDEGHINAQESGHGLNMPIPPRSLAIKPGANQLHRYARSTRHLGRREILGLHELHEYVTSAVLIGLPFHIGGTILVMLL